MPLTQMAPLRQISTQTFQFLFFSMPFFSFASHSLIMFVLLYFFFLRSFLIQGWASFSAVFFKRIWIERQWPVLQNTQYFLRFGVNDAHLWFCYIKRRAYIQQSTKCDSKFCILLLFAFFQTFVHKHFKSRFLVNVHKRSTLRFFMYMYILYIKPPTHP